MVMITSFSKMGPFRVLFQEILKGSFMSIYISIIDSKMLLKNDLFGTSKPSEL